jgi:hypothetical protein
VSNRFFLYTTITLIVYATASNANETLEFAWPDKMNASVGIQVKGSRTVSTEGTYAWKLEGATR